MFPTRALPLRIYVSPPGGAAVWSPSRARVWRLRWFTGGDKQHFTCEKQTGGGGRRAPVNQFVQFRTFVDRSNTTVYSTSSWVMTEHLVTENCKRYYDVAKYSTYQIDQSVPFVYIRYSYSMLPSDLIISILYYYEKYSMAVVSSDWSSTNKQPQN